MSAAINSPLQKAMFHDAVRWNSQDFFSRGASKQAKAPRLRSERMIERQVCLRVLQAAVDPRQPCRQDAVFAHKMNCQASAKPFAIFTCSFEDPGQAEAIHHSFLSVP